MVRVEMGLGTIQILGYQDGDGHGFGVDILVRVVLAQGDVERCPKMDMIRMCIIKGLLNVSSFACKK